MDKPLFISLAEKITMKSMDELDPIALTPSKTADLIYETLFLFKKIYGRIKVTPYNPRFEYEASTGIVSCTEALSLAPLEKLSIQANRVLFERCQQVIAISFGWDKEVMTHIPRELPLKYWQLYAATYWLHKKELPFEPQNKLPDSFPELREVSSSSQLQ